MLDDRELELIAELVEGRLEDETRARALIERSSEARAEYEAQRAAYEALRADPPAEMSETERAAVRRDVWTALREEETPSRGKTPWFYKWLPVAAGLFVVIGLLAILDQAGDDSLTESFAEIGDELGDDSSMSDAADAESAETDPDEESAAASAASPAEVIGAAEFFSETADRVRSGDFEGSSTASSRDLEEFDPASCTEEAGVQAHDIVGEATHTSSEGDSTVSTNYLVLVPSDTEIGPDTPVTFVSTDVCEIAHVDE